MEEFEKPKPCPFCGKDLTYKEFIVKKGEHRGALMRYYRHDKRRCILDTMEVTFPDIKQWNRRA